MEFRICCLTSLSLSLVHAFTQDGTTSMMMAAKNGHEAVVVTLHGLGADVNAKDNVSRMIDKTGRELLVCLACLLSV